MSNTKEQIFSDRLKRRRAAMGYTQKKFAAAVGVEQSAVGNWETGRNFPAPQQRQKISEILRVSQEWLEGATDLAEPIVIAETIIASVGPNLLGKIEGYAELLGMTPSEFATGVLREFSGDFVRRVQAGQIKNKSGLPISSVVANALEHEELPPLDEGPNRPPKS